MNEDERATHFQGFAKLLYDDFLQLAREDTSDINEMFAPDYVEKWRMKVEHLIAQRAYDLMFHAVKHSLPYQQGDRVVKYIVSSHIPDLTQWPEGEQ